MNLVVLQQGGLGDIFFIQKLLKEFHKKYEVYHPVTKEMWDAGCCQLRTPVNTGWNIQIPRSDVFAYDCSKQPLPNGTADIMTSKYAGANMDWTDWSKHFSYERDYEREYSLYSQLGLNDGQPYIFANSWYSFRKPHHGVQLSIPEDYDGKVIWMDPNLTERVFDWCSVIENAEQIHIVDTCLNYIIDTLNIQADTLVCHPRHYKNTEECVGKLFSAPWQWVDYEQWLWREKVPQELE